MSDRLQPSKRSEIAPFYVMEVMKEAGERSVTHGDVIHLEVGQPGTPAPARVRETARKALTVDRLGYTDALGLRDLREAIARHHATRGQSVDPDRVVVTVGASGGFVLALLAGFDVGARVGITEPGYAAYRNIIEALGLELVGIPVGAASRWVPTPALLESSSPLDGLVVASPSNPTGTALRRDEMAAIHAWCERTGTVLISDEIYHGITYGSPAVGALEIADDVIVVQSFSKYFSMTGWRIGWLVAPPSLLGPLERLSQNLFISPPTLAQLAAIEAFSATSELDAIVERYSRSRAMLVEALDGWGLPYAPPDGAFYLWVDVSSLGIPSTELCRRLLGETGVAITPGIDFDPLRGDRHIRISYSEAPDDIAEAVRRIGRWIDTLDGSEG